jgi:hypothetical protein
MVQEGPRVGGRSGGMVQEDRLYEMSSAVWAVQSDCPITFTMIQTRWH